MRSVKALHMTAALSSPLVCFFVFYDWSHFNPGLPVRLAGFRLMEAGLEPKPETEGWEKIRILA